MKDKWDVGSETDQT